MIKTTTPKIDNNTVSIISNVNVLPFKKIPLSIVTKYLAGIMCVRIWSGCGMFDMANINPERRNAGRNVVTIAIWLDTSCDLAMIDIRIPKLRLPKRNSDENAISKKTLPTNSTLNKKTTIRTDVITSIKPMIK